MDTEQIVLEIDERPAVAAAGRGNQAIAQVEQTSVRAGAAIQKTVEQQAESIVRISERSRQSTERLVASIEKRASAAGQSRVQQLAAERDQLVQRLSGDTNAVNRATAAFDKLILAQQQLDKAAADKAALAERDRLLQAAVRGSERAAQASLQFERALQQVNRQAAAEAKTLEESVKVLERRAALTDKSGSQRLAAERDDFLAKNKGLNADQVDRTNQAYNKLIATQRQLEDRSVSLKEFLANPLNAASNAAEGLFAKLGPVGTALSALIVVGGYAANKIFDLVAAQGKAAEESANLADRLDISASQAFELQAIAKVAGVNIGALEGASKLLAVALEDSTGAGAKTAKALNELGVSTVTVSGDARELGPVLLDLLNNLSQVPDASDRIRLANQALGRGAKELLPVINGLQQIRKDLNEAGIALDDNLIKKLAGADDKIDRLELAWSVFKSKLAEKFEPIVIPVVLAFTRSLNTTPGIATPGGALLGQPQQSQSLDSPGLGDDTRRWLRLQAEGLANSDIRAGDRRRDEFIKKQLETERGVNQELSSLNQQRSALVNKLSQPGIGGQSRALFEKDLADLDRQIAAFEARKRAIDESQRKAEEQRKLAERGQNTFKDILRANALGTGFAGTSFEVKTADIQRVKDDEDRRKGLESAYREQAQFEQETLRLKLETIDKGLAEEQDGIRRSREIQLAQLDGVNAKTLEQKLAVEGRRLAIEEDYLNKSAALQIEEITRKKDREIEYLEFLKIVRPEAEAQINARIDAVNEAAGQAARKVEQDWLGNLEKARTDANARGVKLIQTQQEQLMESIRRGYETTLDALLSSSRSWGDRLRAIWEAVIFAPLKKAAAELFTRLTVGASGGGGGNAGGILGAIFGGGNPGTVLSAAGGGAGSNPFIFNSLPGTASQVTSLGRYGIFGPVSGGATGAGASRFAGLAGLGGLFFNSGSISLGAGAATTAAGIGGIGGTLAGLATSPAALIAGGLLGYEGVKRGGLLGAGMSIGGGALAGAAAGTLIFPGIGTLVGAAIGASIGGVASLARLFYKGSVDKMKEKIKATYGIEVNDRKLLEQFVGIAKQNFAGNLDMAIRSPQIRDLIELYSMSTGQQASNMPAKMQAINLYQSGGSLFQQPVSTSNQGLPSVSGGAVGGFTNLTLQLDPGTTAAILTGTQANVLASNPNMVSRAAYNGARNNALRRDMAAVQMSPGLLLS